MHSNGSSICRFNAILWHCSTVQTGLARLLLLLIIHHKIAVKSFGLQLNQQQQKRWLCGISKHMLCHDHTSVGIFPGTFPIFKSRDFWTSLVPGPQDHGTFKVSRSCPVPSRPGTFPGLPGTGQSCCHHYYIGQTYGRDFAKFCGLLRIYEL